MYMTSVKDAHPAVKHMVLLPGLVPVVSVAVRPP